MHSSYPTFLFPGKSDKHKHYFLSLITQLLNVPYYEISKSCRFYYTFPTTTNSRLYFCWDLFVVQMRSKYLHHNKEKFESLWFLPIFKFAKIKPSSSSLDILSELRFIQVYFHHRFQEIYLYNTVYRWQIFYVFSPIHPINAESNIDR